MINAGIDRGMLVIDINNDFPITLLKNTNITNDMCSFVPVGVSYEVNPFEGGYTGLTLIDISGDTWFFITGGKTPGLRHRYYHFPNYGMPEKYFFGKMKVNDEGQMYLIDYYEDTFSFTPDYDETFIFYLYANGNSIDRTKVGVNDTFIEYDLIIMCKDGFISMKRETSGIKIETTPLSVSIPKLDHGETFIKDNYLYYLENTSIKRIHLSSGSSAETIYSNNRILTTESITLSGDMILFYQFADDNISVNTYSLLLNQNATPRLHSTSMVEIKSIVELDF
jgi:hypothetical protein